MSWLRKPWTVATLIVGAAVAIAAAPYVSTARFLLDVSGQRSWITTLPPHPRPIATLDLTVPTRHGAVAARAYVPDRTPSHTAVVFPGVHGGGADEPRLVAFCRRLAATGVTVVCVPLPDLRVFQVTSRSTDQIEDATVWIAANRDLVPGGRVALVGVSFAGGLVLVAAGRPALADKIELVLSVGGHGDLPRTLRFLCTGVLPDGGTRTPHDYGLAIVALKAAASLVPADQVAPLEAGVRAYLDASVDESASQSVAAPLLARARRAAESMPEPSRSIMDAVNRHDVSRLGAILAPVVDRLAGDPALSPERSPATMAPVFLLHGLEDNVIPTSETPALASYLEAHGNRSVRALVTPALTHTGLEGRISIADGWRLVRFWRVLLDRLD